MQRSHFAQKIAAEKCLTLHGEKICSQEFSNIVADLLPSQFPETASAAALLANENTGNLKFLAEDGSVNLASEVPSPDDEGCCSAANPYVPVNIAPIVLVLDIFLPGVGTIISAYYDPSGCNCKTITCGIFQMLTVIILVGWIWSIW